MAKAATSGQARALNAAIISRIDEEALKQIDGEKLQKAIDNPEGLIHSFIKFINNDCRFLIGPLIIDLKSEPKPLHGFIKSKNHIKYENIVFENGGFDLIKKHREGEMHISLMEYKKRIDEDPLFSAANANMVDFFENYQYVPIVAEFLNPYKKDCLYQIGTVFQGNNDLITFLYWNGKKWLSGIAPFDDNCIISGYVFVIKN